MVAKYRVALTELEIAKAAQCFLECKQYDLYVLFNKQLDRIVGGGKTADYEQQGTRRRDSTAISRGTTTDFALGIDQGKYIPGTQIKSAVTLRDKFLVMGHSRSSWTEIDLMCIEFGMDTSMPERDRKFFEHLQCHTGYVCNTLGDKDKACLVFDFNIDMIDVVDFSTEYADMLGKYRIAFIPLGSTVVQTLEPVTGALGMETKVIVDTKETKQVQPIKSFMEYIPPVDSMSQPRNEVQIPNTVVDVLNKFGL